MGNFSSIINTWLANRRTMQSIRNITLNNEMRRNITRYEPSDIEGFIERDKYVGSYIISGGELQIRNRAAASVVACSLMQRIPVIILHEGDYNLQSQIASATSFTRDKVIINRNNSVYDPFYNRSNQEICNLIINSTKNGYEISAIGQQYILGITEFIKSKNIPPYCEMFVRCPYDNLFEKIDDSLNQDYMSDQKAANIRNLLMQGQSERAKIQSFFSQLANQGTSVLSNKVNRNAAVNIRTSVDHNGLIMIDIGSSINDMLLSIIMNEIKEVLATGKQIVLVLDNIYIDSNYVLSRIIKSISNKCLTTIISHDAYSMFGADDNSFISFIGNASKCIVFSHSVGISCSKWADVFGYYDADKVSQSLGHNQNYQCGYGFGSSNSISVSTSREYIVKPEEIARMAPNEVYILDRNAQELAYTTLR